MSTQRTVALAALADAACVIAFAVMGRASHAEGLDAVGVWTTAWPFLAGAAAGWIVIRAWRRPLAPWPTGAVVWIAALVVGMGLRWVTGQGTAPAFVIVAALTLALFLVGWRAAAVAVTTWRARGRARATPRC